MKQICIALIIASSLPFLVAGGRSKRDAAHPRHLLCHYNTDSVRRFDKGKLSAADLDPQLCTHLVYSSMKFSGSGHLISAVHALDYGTKTTPGALKEFGKLKEKNSNLKTIIAFSEGSTYFSEMASSKENRANFIKNVMTFVETHHFDGVELVWDEPNVFMRFPQDKENYVLLASELKKALGAKSLIVSVPGNKFWLEKGFNLAELAKHVDLMSLSTYHYHDAGFPEGITYPHSALHGSAKHDTNDMLKEKNIDWTYTYLAGQGVPANKMILGLATHAHPYHLRDPNKNGIGEHAISPQTVGPYLWEQDVYGYNEFCEMMKNDAGKWKITRDHDYRVPYAVNNDIWVSYDDAQSLGAKVKFAKKKGMAGVAVHSLDTDDFLGFCHGDKYPLVNAVKKALVSN